MNIIIYNTLTRKKEMFQPVKTGEVRIYLCGPTVYDACHIGHARSAIVFDVIVKYLRSLGQKVLFVRNFTDIDDKIIERSNRLGIPYRDLTQKYINSFCNDMNKLGVESADIEPRVTEHMDSIIEFIKVLIKNKSAYSRGGDVYFSVDALNSYGKLSGRNKNEIFTGSRIKVNRNKNKPLDFALWKSVRKGEPFWDSPWGRGRPGWHIECSAMSRKLLGQPIDIHGGGEDLIFPHHENEIAQSEAAYKLPLANYWVHHGMVNIGNEKMSKSLKNLKCIEDLNKSYHRETVRTFLLSNHYRSPINFSKQVLNSWDKSLTRAYRVLEKASIYLDLNEGKCSKRKGPLWKKFCDAMNNDFNTAKCIGILFGAVKKIHKVLHHNYVKNNVTMIRQTVRDIHSIGKIMGMLTTRPKDFLSREKNDQVDFGLNSESDEIEKLVILREKARYKKNWIEADRLRLQLNKIGVKIEDGPDGPSWKFT